MFQLSISNFFTTTFVICTEVWLNGLVVSAVGIRARGPGFDSQVVPLFHWVATLGKLFTYMVPQFLSSKKLGYKKESNWYFSLAILR